MERKEAIEIVKNNFPYGRIQLREALTTLIPELNEIDDEKIRQALLKFFSDGAKNNETTCDIPDEKIVAWLEKQGGQKEIDYNEEINKCKANPLYFIDKYVTVKLKEQNNSSFEKQGEQKPDLNEKDETNAPTEYGKYVDKCLNEAAKHFFSEGEDKYSVADLFYAGIKCGQSWLEKQSEQKYVLSEVDENIRKSLIENFKFFGGDYLETSKWGKNDDLLVTDIIAWLEKQGLQKEINLIEILKHYPRETELYSPIYGKLWLAEVDEKNEIITCYKHCLDKGCTRAILEQEDTVSFYSNGTTGLPDYTISKDCMLFLYDIEKQNTDNDKVEPKFKVGDWVVGEGCICKVIDIRGRFYRLYFPDGKTGNIDIYYADEKFHHWTIEDAKDGDVISYDDGWTCIFKCIHGIWFSSHCFITDEGEFYKGYERHEVDSTIRSNINPSTKEQRDILFQKMEEAGYKWDVNRKEMVSISKDE